MIRNERGSSSIMGLIGILLMFFFMGIALDTGLFIGKYKGLEQAVAAVNAEVDGMLPYYLYSNDSEAHFREVVTDIMSKKGLKYGELRCSLEKQMGYRAGEAKVITEIHIYTRYNCRLVGIMGIWCNFPLVIDDETTHVFWMSGMPSVYDKDPIVIWGEEEENEEEY